MTDTLFDLHGSIRVTGTLVASWSATRLPDSTHLDGSNLYRCDYEASMTTTPPGFCSFPLRHRFQDGAAVLAAKVLLEAARLLAEDSR